jgi:hypothetical protein
MLSVTNSGWRRQTGSRRFAMEDCELENFSGGRCCNREEETENTKTKRMRNLLEHNEHNNMGNWY